MLLVGKAEHDVLEIKIAVKNLNEEAYDAKIILQFPETLEFLVFAEMALTVCISIILSQRA